MASAEAFKSEGFALHVLTNGQGPDMRIPAVDQLTELGLAVEHCAPIHQWQIGKDVLRICPLLTGNLGIEIGEGTHPDDRQSIFGGPLVGFDELMKVESVTGDVEFPRQRVGVGGGLGGETRRVFVSGKVHRRIAVAPEERLAGRQIKRAQESEKYAAVEQTPVQNMDDLDPVADLVGAPGNARRQSVCVFSPSARPKMLYEKSDGMKRFTPAWREASSNRT